MIYVKDLIEVCNGKLLCGDINLPLNNFSKDTRLINKDDVYIGIKGESFDGNKFYKDALDKKENEELKLKTFINSLVEFMNKNEYS